MPSRRIAMRQLTEILRLKHEARLSHARPTSKGVVSKYVGVANAKGVGSPLPEGMDEAALERLLFPDVRARRQIHRAGPPGAQAQGRDAATAVGGVRRRARVEALRYSQFCQRYRDWRATQRRSMRQQHIAGKKLSICGHTVPFIDTSTGEVVEAQVFVAVWGASS